VWSVRLNVHTQASYTEDCIQIFKFSPSPCRKLNTNRHHSRVKSLTRLPFTGFKNFDAERKKYINICRFIYYYIFIHIINIIYNTLYSWTEEQLNILILIYIILFLFITFYFHCFDFLFICFTYWFGQLSPSHSLFSCFSLPSLSLQSSYVSQNTQLSVLIMKPCLLFLPLSYCSSLYAFLPPAIKTALLLIVSSISVYPSIIFLCYAYFSR
jgi:hypothetical protein